MEVMLPERTHPVTLICRTHEVVKLATWNCCGKFGTNLPHLLGEAVDLAVVCEASPLPEWPTGPGDRAVTHLSRRVTPNSAKELAVVACDPWSVSRHEQADSA